MPYKDIEKRRECVRKSVRKRYHADPEAARERDRKRYADNPEAHREASRKYREDNKEAVLERGRVHDRRRYRDNPKRKGQAIAGARHRRAAKLSATPPWQSHAEVDAIWANCPPGYHCDHIAPLKGKLACGLNVPWNLQYLPDAENMSKGNRPPSRGYADWFSEPWTVHAEPEGRVRTLTNHEVE